MGPVGTPMRTAVVAILLAFAVVGCSPRPGIVPLCEGVAYVSQSNHIAALAIGAIVRNDLPQRDFEVKRARASLREARGKLAEAAGDKTGDWATSTEAFGRAIDRTSAVIDQTSLGTYDQVASLRTELAEAEKALTELGPPSGCIPDPSYWSDSPPKG